MTIAEFPVELVLKIASYVGYEGTTLTNLALTCRHLYAVLIPGILDERVQCIPKVSLSFLPEHGWYTGSDPWLTVIRNDEPDHNPRRSEPFGGSYRLLTFNPGTKVKEFLCVQSLLARAEKLDEVQIILGGRQTTPRILATVINRVIARPNIHLKVSGSLPAQDPLEYGSEFNGVGPFIFEQFTISAKEFVHGGKDAERNYFNNLFNKLARFFRRTSTVPQPRWEEHAQPYRTTIIRKPTIEFPLTPHRELSKFFIATDSLFLPSFYPFTKALLNTAKLTHLSLSHIRLNHFSWAEILPTITIPTLRELCIGTVTIAFPDLLMFLGRRCHESIKLLDFTGNDPIGLVQLPSLTILHSLISLTANAEYLGPFLEKRREGYFPALQLLGISAPREPVYPEKYGFPLHPIYDLILGDRPYESIKIDHTANSGIIEWIVSTSECWPLQNPFVQLQQLILGDISSVNRQSFGTLPEWLVGPPLQQNDHHRWHVSVVEQFIKWKIPSLKDLSIRPETIMSHNSNPNIEMVFSTPSTTSI